MKKRLFCALALTTCAFAFTACSDDDGNTSTDGLESDYIGKKVGNFTADEWYPGGELGTTDNVTAGGYEDNTPAVDNQGLTQLFNIGDEMAGANYTLTKEPFKGWGPVASRPSCESCHPTGYNHGMSRSDFQPVYGDGYIVSVYTPDGSDANNADGYSNDGEPVPQLTTFTMTMAQEPFLPPLDPNKVTIQWHDVTSMPNTEIKKGAKDNEFAFPDGETFSLRYPTVNVPQDAFNADPKPEGYAVRLLVSCNFQGLGLIDAISNDDLEKQYEEEGKFAELNPQFFDNTTKKLKDDAWVEDAYGKKFIKRFNYDLLDGCLENDGALWDELSVTRPDKHWLCTTEPYAKAMSQNKEVISYIKEHGKDPNSLLHPYYYDGTDEGISEAVYYLLAPEGVGVDLYNNKYYNFTPDMTDAKQYQAFMTWHRGLAVPRARNLNDSQVQRGKKLFEQMGCTNCHKQTWTTGDDNYGSSEFLNHAELPKYPHQTIHPYSDFIQHKLCMINDIHGSWCRTTPLWGRGLSMANSGREDRLHDARARNVIEAIMWHCYSKNSQAYSCAMQFYNLQKADRDAVVKFINSI